MKALAESEGTGATFLCGFVQNEVEVWDFFAGVSCLVIDEETLRYRLATRTTNMVGKDPGVLEQVVRWNQDVEERYRSNGAEIIDATRPLEAVVTYVLA